MITWLKKLFRRKPVAVMRTSVIGPAPKPNPWPSAPRRYGATTTLKPSYSSPPAASPAPNTSNDLLNAALIYAALSDNGPSHQSEPEPMRSAGGGDFGGGGASSSWEPSSSSCESSSSSSDSYSSSDSGSSSSDRCSSSSSD